MKPPARVTSFDLLRDFRASLATFREEARDALDSANMDIQRAFDWLADTRQMWVAAVRTRYDEVVQAKAALARKQIFLPGERQPDTTEEIKDLRRAIARLEEAEDKVEKTRRWEPLLRRGVEEYNAPARSLEAYLEIEMPRSITLLDRILGSLEEYAALAPTKAGDVAESTPPAVPVVGETPP